MAASSVLRVNYRGEELFVNVFVPNKESCLRQNCEYLISFYSKEKKFKKCLCFLKIRVLSLYVDMLFHKIEGNGGARGA